MPRLSASTPGERRCHYRDEEHRGKILGACAVPALRSRGVSCVCGGDIRAMGLWAGLCTNVYVLFSALDLRNQARGECRQGEV